MPSNNVINDRRSASLVQGNADYHSNLATVEALVKASTDGHFFGSANAPTMLLNTRQTARLLGMSESKLHQDRCKNRGLAYIFVGRSVRYEFAEIIKFINNNRIEPLC